MGWNAACCGDRIFCHSAPSMVIMLLAEDRPQPVEIFGVVVGVGHQHALGMRRLGQQHDALVLEADGDHAAIFVAERHENLHGVLLVQQRRELVPDALLFAEPMRWRIGDCHIRHFICLSPCSLLLEARGLCLEGGPAGHGSGPPRRLQRLCQGIGRPARNLPRIRPVSSIRPSALSIFGTRASMWCDMPLRPAADLTAVNNSNQSASSNGGEKIGGWSLICVIPTTELPPTELPTTGLPTTRSPSTCAAPEATSLSARG